MGEEARGVTGGGGRLSERLSHVFWIGGGSCAGKSTIARRLADEFGLYVYASDDVMAEHCRRSKAEECPLLSEFMAMDMDERWVNRSPERMLETFPWFRGEGFHLILEDLLSLPADSQVIVEGFRLLPRLVKPVLAARDHAVWLLPPAEFRHATIERRGWGRCGFPARTSDPERALQNLLARDGMFTERLQKEVEELELRWVAVNAALAEDECARLVAKLFGL